MQYGKRQTGDLVKVLWESEEGSPRLFFLFFFCHVLRKQARTQCQRGRLYEGVLSRNFRGWGRNPEAHSQQAEQLIEGKLREGAWIANEEFRVSYKCKLNGR